MRNNFIKENKQLSQIQWLSHYYLPEKISSKYSKNIFDLIKQVFIDTHQKFGKAVIYATSTKSASLIATSLQNLKQFKQQPNIVIMNSSHSRQRIKQKQGQFILIQSKILITTLQPAQTFKSGVIDVENVNLIINQVLPTNAEQYRARLVKSKLLDQSCKGVVINMIQKNSKDFFYYIGALQKQLNISISEYTPKYTNPKITNAKQSPHKLNKYQRNQTNNLLGSGQKFFQVEKTKLSLIKTKTQEEKQLFTQQKMIGKIDSKGVVQSNNFNNPITLNRNQINQNISYLKQSKQAMSKQDKFNNLNLNRPLNSNKNLQYENQIQKQITQKNFQITPQKQQKGKKYLTIHNNKKIQQSPDSNQLIQQNYSPYYKQFSGSNGSQNQKYKSSRIRQQPYISQYKQTDQIENIKIKQNNLKNKIEDQTALNTNKNQKIIQQTIKNSLQPLLKQIKQSNKQVLVGLNDVEKNLKKQIREEITNNMSKATTQMIIQVNQAKQLYRQLNKNQNAVGQTQLQKHLITKLEKVQQGNKKIQQNVYQFQTTLNKFVNQKHEQKKPSNEVIPILLNRIQDSQKNLKDTMMTSINQLQKKITKANKEELVVISAEIVKLKEAIAHNIKSNRTIQQSRSQNKVQFILTQNNKQIKGQLMDLQQKMKHLTKVVQNQQSINRDYIDRLDKSRQQKINISPKIGQSRIKQQRQQQIKIKNQQGQINSLKIQLSDKLKTIQQLNHKSKYQKLNIEKNKTLELINQTLQIYEPSMLLTEQNIQRQLPQFIYRRSKKDFFLVQSDMYENMRNDLKQFVYSTVKKYCRSKQIVKTRKLFEADKNSQFNNWLTCLQKKSHILALVQISNGFIIGGFSQSFYDSQRYKEIDPNARGCMMSVTNKRVYDLKPKYYGRALKPDDYLFFLGNNQLKLSTLMEFQVLFSGIYRFFEGGSDTIQDFIGQKETKGTYQRVQFHQIFLK